MRKRVVIAAPLGLAVALACAGFPASAADPTIAANSATDTWDPSTTSIHVGDSVTWTNDNGFHNVCVQKPGSSSGCDEFRNGDPGPTWTSVSHKFTAAGTYSFFCEQHKLTGMSGTITVEPTSTGTSTTAPEPITDTITVPTQTTETTSTPADTTAPLFTGKLKRRSSRKALVLEVGSSEAATLKANVLRRPPRGRSFSQTSQATLKVRQGKNVVTLPRTAVRAGSYRVKLQLVDEAGNKSPTKTLVFKIA